MEVDRIPPADSGAARLRGEPGTPAVERQQRPPPIAPSREDRWEGSGSRPEDEAEHHAPQEAEREEEEESSEDIAGPGDAPHHIDTRA